MSGYGQESTSGSHSGGGNYGDDRKPHRSSHDSSSRRYRSRSPPRNDRNDRNDRGSSRNDDRRNNYDSRDSRDGGRRRDDYDDRRGGGRRDDYRGGNGGGGGGGGRGYQGNRDRDNGGGSGAASGGRGGRVFEGFGSPTRRSPTPESTIPISKRKRKFTAWDVKPAGFDNYTAEQAKMTGMFNLPGQNRPSMPGVIGSFGVPIDTFHPAPGQTGANAPLGSLARQSRRLYVGNITTEATEEVISSFFNGKMKEMGLLSDKGLGEDLQGLGLVGDEPVISVHLNYEKNYAFVEFRNSDEASSAMAFDGIIFQNNALKIRRPKDFLGLEDGGTGLVPGVVSTNVPDTVNKIFVGGLPSYLTDEQVMELLSSFGDLRSFNLVKEGGTGASKGFAFCEYVDPSVTEVACQGLNGMELGDRYLVVQRAALGANPMKAGMMGQTMADFGPGSVPVTAPSILAASSSDASSQATRVLQMLNMVAVEELIGDEDYLEILEDIKEECSKYGKVEEVKIPRPIKTEKNKVDIKASEAIKDLGKVFVLFEKEEETTKALRAIAGRQFGGRMIICAYAELELFLGDL